MNRIALAALLAAWPLSGGDAQSLLDHAPPQSDRTVAWYADHPGALAAVTRVCRNDPGHGATNPDCMNASEAQVEVALRDARRHVDMTPPSDPHYWTVHPNELPATLLACARMPAQYQAANFCDSARAAGGSRRR